MRASGARASPDVGDSAHLAENIAGGALRLTTEETTRLDALRHSAD
ncbi:hypothetical protein AB0H97_27750 [Streptomyces sp. NPDC050788]